LASLWVFFDSPGRAYNLVSLLLAAIGVGLGGWALVFAYWQIRKTLTAAEAAQRAAEATYCRAESSLALSDLNALCAKSSEIAHLIRANNLGGAAIRSQDLRVGIAVMRRTKIGATLLTDHDWQQMVTELEGVQVRFEKQLAAGKQTDVARALKTILSINERLHAMVPRLGSTGDLNAIT
jgi:hypothetical protein